MKALWISALLLLTCAGALTGISKSLAPDAAEPDQLAAVRSTSDPFVLAASLQRGFTPALPFRAHPR